MHNADIIVCVVKARKTKCDEAKIETVDCSAVSLAFLTTNTCIQNLHFVQTYCVQSVDIIIRHLWKTP